MRLTASALIAALALLAVAPAQAQQPLAVEVRNKSIPTLCYEIQSEARKMATAEHEGPNLTLRVHPEIAKALKTRESMLMDELEQNSHKHIIIQSDATLHWEQYDIY